MADSAAGSKRSFNPLVLHLQKLALELKCPLWFVVVILISSGILLIINYYIALS